MALTPGTRLGRYEVVAQIDVGGMGEVYRARDTKLDRSVAVKILHESFAQDPERLARFECEAKTLAALTHPNIAIIHGFEEAADIKALAGRRADASEIASRGGPFCSMRRCPSRRRLLMRSKPPTSTASFTAT